MRSTGIRRGSRRFLAALGAVLVCGSMAAAQQAPAATPGLGDGKIQHVVLIYQENHSFDETLGYVCKLRATPCDGFTGTVTLSDGTPFRMKVSPDVVPEAAHFVKAQNIAINGGRMDGFDKIGGCKSKLHHCISYYKPRQIPNLAALADQYVVADRTFEMAPRRRGAGTSTRSPAPSTASPATARSTRVATRCRPASVGVVTRTRTRPGSRPRATC